MKLKLVFIGLLILLGSCKENKRKKETSPEPEIPNKEVTSVNPEPYSNQQWGFSLNYPENYILTESKLPGSSPVINVYDKSIAKKPPLAIHEGAGLSYIAVLPKGFGVDGPSGKSLSVSKWPGTLELKEDMDPEKSKVYLLESGEPWAFKMMFKNPPESWSESGSIFVHFKIESFKAECVNEDSGEVKSMENCDPMGNDSVRLSGQINEESRRALQKIIESLKFSQGRKKEKVADILKVETPFPNIDVRSPIKITGKAKGYWFFEGSAPVKLVDKDNNILAKGKIETKGNWMTEDFVPFQGSVTFDNAPDDERGYLIFERANASGKPENAQSYRLPVLFPPK